MEQFCDKEPKQMPDGSYRVTVHTNSQTFVIKVSEEDLDAINHLMLRTQYSRGSLRCLIWVDRKSLSLSRFIQEGAEPRDDMDKLYVRHVNGDTLDFRRDNLAWSLGKSGRIITPSIVGDRHEKERKVVLRWKGLRMIFLEQEEADAAYKRLEAGENPNMIMQTGRQRFREVSTIAADSTADWAMWLRARRREIAEIREWLNMARLPKPYEDEYLKRILMEGMRYVGTPDCKLFAVGVAMWMDRKAQSEPDLPEYEHGNLRRINTIAKNYSYHDPFEDFSDESARAHESWAYPEMPNVKASFLLKSEVD